MTAQTTRRKQNRKIYAWLDAIALIAWGSLLLKYSVTGEYKLLIHPNYFGLVLATSIILLLLGIVEAIACMRGRRSNAATVEHITLFPPAFSRSLLIVVAIAGLIVPPTILSSQTALKLGVNDVPLTRSQPQSFYTATPPKERSLIDWIRTVNAYPEPDAYSGQSANISGFVLHRSELPDNYLLLARFVITCCAVDAYPIGIPVKLQTSRNDYPPDTWLEVQGTMITETLPVTDDISQTTQDKRQLVLAATSINQIPTPSDPYSYN